MIWFAGILQNTCCNNSKKIKQKYSELWVWCLLTTHIECHIGVFAMKTHTKKKTQKTNTFNFSCFGNQQFYLFWTPPPLFSWVNGRTFFGRTLSRSHMVFFDLCPVRTAFWMGSWRNAWHCLFGSRKWRCWRKARETLISRLMWSDRIVRN